MSVTIHPEQHEWMLVMQRTIHIHTNCIWFMLRVTEYCNTNSMACLCRTWHLWHSPSIFQYTKCISNTAYQQFASCKHNIHMSEGTATDWNWLAHVSMWQQLCPKLGHHHSCSTFHKTTRITSQMAIQMFTTLKPSALTSNYVLPLKEEIMFHIHIQIQMAEILFYASWSLVFGRQTG